MPEFVNALWELRTWCALIIGVSIGLMAASLMVMGRRSEEFDDGPDTILILPPDEPMEQVDIDQFIRRYS